MSAQTINGITLYNYLLGGFKNLKINESTINDLNVFPIPDGDTGANMAMTLSGGVAAAENKEAVGEMMAAFSQGTLFSARGNSGVILSQFIRGFSNAVVGFSEITPRDFANALRQGAEHAYHSVVRPVEGTILTVMRESGEFICENLPDGGFVELFQRLIPQMRVSLNNTPNLLAVLKEAGVVDSGGAGLLCIFEGMQAIAEGRDFENVSSFQVQSAPTLGYMDENTKLEFGYCTEFILQLMNYKPESANFSLQEMIAFLESIGDSVVAVQDGLVVKVHVHTFEPEKVLAYVHPYGEFYTLKIENMTVQHNEANVPAPKAEHKKFAIVATATGKGLCEYFKSIGADIIVDGMQTQNPSTEDFVKAFDQLDAEHIIVLPNNKNIIMAAQQAADLYEKAQVTVLKTRTLAEGYSALSMVDPYAETLEEFVGAMSSSLEYVTTAYVTTAIRDTVMNGVNVVKGAYIGLDNESILYSCDNKVETAIQTLKAIPNINSKETVIVFYGSDATEQEVAELESSLRNAFPLFDIGFVDGGQPVYPFIISIE